MLDDRRLSARNAAADFSRLRNADLGRFTLDRLMKMLVALNHNLRVTVHVDPKHEGGAATVAWVESTAVAA